MLGKGRSATCHKERTRHQGLSAFTQDPFEVVGKVAIWMSDGLPGVPGYGAASAGLAEPPPETLTNGGSSELAENSCVAASSEAATCWRDLARSVAYGVDKAEFREVVLAAARALPVTMADDPVRKMQVWMTGFGASALNFELVVWPTLEAVRGPSAMHAALCVGD